MKVCILIPSYNEAKTIGSIVKDLKSKDLDTLVVDDGSIDDTAKIAAQEGAIVISHKMNLGKGASIKEGFNFIINSTNYDAVIIMDGDGQHHTEDIFKFIDHASKYGDDLVIGNRMGFTKNMPASRFVTNKIASYVISVMCKQNIPDTQCGYRLLKRSTISRENLLVSNC